MNSFDLTDGMVARNDDNQIALARLQQEIAQLVQNEKVLSGGICPFSGERPEHCAYHNERHAPLLKAQAKALASLRQQVKTYTAA